MDEEEIYEGLGLEVPEEPGPGEEPADTPVEGVTEAGASDETTEENPLGEQEGHAGGTGPRPRDAAMERSDAFSAENARILDEAYRAAFAGRLNPYTGKPITTKAEFNEYQSQLQADQQRARMEQLRKAGVDPAAIQAIIDQHPVVREAQQVIQEAQAERERAQVTQARGWYGEQIKAINALDPEAKVGSLDDLAARDPAQYAKMLGMVAGGVSLADAYKALNFDTLAQKRAAAAKQAVMNQAAGKAHLAPAGGQGVGGVEVPGGVREMYRELNPDMTDAQISAAYAAYLKETQ